MIVKVRFPEGSPLQHRRGTNRALSAAFGALLVPAALMAYSLGFWRLASDIGLAGQFGITGVFSHWQLWIGLGITMNVAAVTLNRYGRSGQLEVPKLMVFPTRPETPPQERKGA